MSKIEAERLNQEGIKQLQNGKLEEASTLFLKAIESDAAYAFPYCHIGNIKVFGASNCYSARPCFSVTCQKAN